MRRLVVPSRHSDAQVADLWGHEFTQAYLRHISHCTHHTVGLVYSWTDRNLFLLHQRRDERKISSEKNVDKIEKI